jgi:hypothetical protein
MAGETRGQSEAEIGAIFTRLQQEIRSGRSARAQAEQAWAVTAERPFERPPTRRGFVQSYFVVPVKRVLRKLMRWYVEPVAADQRSFNLAVLTIVDELTARFDSELDRLERRLDVLEAQITGQAERSR